MLLFSTASTQYVPVNVSAIVANTVYNMTADVVQVAFAAGVVNATPAVLTFNAAIWETSGQAYTALCLIGPAGTVQLTAGLWTVFVKVTDNPEAPVLNAGQIRVF